MFFFRKRQLQICYVERDIIINHLKNRVQVFNLESDVFGSIAVFR